MWWRCKESYRSASVKQNRFILWQNPRRNSRDVQERGLGKGGGCLCCWSQSHRKGKTSYNLELAKPEKHNRDWEIMEEKTEVLQSGDWVKHSGKSLKGGKKIDCQEKNKCEVKEQYKESRHKIKRWAVALQQINLALVLYLNVKYKGEQSKKNYTGYLPPKNNCQSNEQKYLLSSHKLNLNCARTLPARKTSGFKIFISHSNVFHKKVLFILLHWGFLLWLLVNKCSALKW